MTPLMLQDALVEEIKNLFAEDRFKAPGDRMVPINVFSQSLPIQESDEDEDPVPYIIVRLSKGIDEGTAESNNTVKLVVIVGLYDMDPNAQGHRDLLHVIGTLYERFQKKPCLAGKYVFTGAFEWAIQEDGYFPYYFGVAEMLFNIPAIRREDEFS